MEPNELTTESLTPDQVERLLEALDKCDDWRAVAAVKPAISTGMRRSEILKLQWQDIVQERGFVLIRDPKGGKSAGVPMNETALAVIDQALNPANPGKLIGLEQARQAQEGAA